MGSFRVNDAPALSGGSTIHSGLTYDRLVYVIQRPLDQIASMPVTGQQLPVGVTVEFAGKRPFDGAINVNHTLELFGIDPWSPHSNIASIEKLPVSKPISD